METNVISDESSDTDMKTMKEQLIEFGLDEENLSKEEMADLLKALNNSKSTAKEDDELRHKVSPSQSPAIEIKHKIEETTPSKPAKILKRRYLNVKDRRMPWSLLPNNITQAEKARVLAVYIKLMAMNKYWQARQLPNFETWPPALQILEEESIKRVHSLRSTRSGRSVPVYADFDDDSSDVDFIVTKPKKRKISGDQVDGVYSNKVVSLKRKTSKEETGRPAKEMKNNNDFCINSTQTKADIYTIVED